MSDWRLQGQERYLKNKTLTKKPYTPYREGWDHDHCEFCYKKFSETIVDCEREGWVTDDNYSWVCLECYSEFKGTFHWS